LSEPSLRTLTEEAAIWSAVKDAVLKRYAHARRAVEEAMRDVGAEKMRARDAGGEEIGTLTIGEGRYVAEIEDLDALVKWVVRNRPDEVHQVVTDTIRPAYLAWIITQAESNAADPEGPGPVAVDRETGAVIPGVKATWRDGSLRVLATGGAKERVAAIVKRTRLAISPAPEDAGVWSDETTDPEEGP